LSHSETGTYERKVLLEVDNLADTASRAISKFYDIAVMLTKLESIRLWDNILVQHDQNQQDIASRMQEILRKLKYRIIEEWVKIEV
jgi:hypothetical protein